MISELLAAKMTIQEIIQDYPAIEEDDISACLFFAAQLSNVKTIQK